MKFRSLPWLTSSAIAFFFIIAFTPACKKSNSSSSSSASVTANISGSNYQSTIVQAVDDRTYFNQLTITAYSISKGDTALLMVSFPDTTVINEVQSIANNSSFSMAYYPSLTSGIEYSADDASGSNASVTVTSYDTTNHKVSGVFSGVFSLVSGSAGAADSVVVSNGKFTTTYKVQ